MHVRHLGQVAILVGFASAASAQTVTPIADAVANLKLELRAEPAPRVPPAVNGEYDPDLKFASWIYVTTAAADWAAVAACSGQANHCSHRHANGLFVWKIKHEAVAVPLGAGIDAAIYYSVREVLGPENPKLAKVLFYALSAARVVVMTHRISQLRDRPDGR